MSEEVIEVIFLLDSKEFDLFVDRREVGQLRHLWMGEKYHGNYDYNPFSMHTHKFSRKEVFNRKKTAAHP